MSRVDAQAELGRCGGARAHALQLARPGGGPVGRRGGARDLRGDALLAGRLQVDQRQRGGRVQPALERVHHRAGVDVLGRASDQAQGHGRADRDRRRAHDHDRTNLGAGWA